MIHRALPATLLALAVPAANAADGARLPPAPQTRLAQVTIRERIIIRVPRVPMPMPMPIRWKEKKGPKCIAAAELAGAMIARPGTLDIATTTGKRIRAVLDDDCPPLDFYSGFYIRPGPDGLICSDRDGIRTRSGATCRIDSYKLLVATK